MKFSWPAILTLVSLIAQRSVFIFIALLANNRLGTAEFARFALGYAFCVNIGQIVSDPLAIAAGVSGQRDQYAQFCRAAFGGGLFVGSITAFVAPLLSDSVGGNLTVPYILAGVILVFQIPANALCGLLYVLGRQLETALVISLTSVGTIIACWAGISLGSSEMLLAIIASSAAILVALLLWLLPSDVKREIVQRFSITLLPWRASIFPTAGTIVLSTPVHLACLSMLANSADGLHQTGLFSTLYVLTSIFTFVPSGLRSLLLPQLAAEVKATRRRAIVQLFGSTWIASCVVLLFVTSFSDRILWLFGSAFASGAYLLYVLCVVGLVMATVMCLNYWMWARDLARKSFYQTVGYAIAYLVAAFYFIQISGEGALGLAKALLTALLIQLTFSVIILVTRR